jgi:hypothetical protein
MIFTVSARKKYVFRLKIFLLFRSVWVMGYSVKLYDILDPGFISLTSEKIVFNFLGFAGDIE